VLSAYRAQDFGGAGARLASLRAARDTRLYQLYAARIAAYLATPPPADWDGVYTFTTK